MSRATSVKQYLAELPEDRRAALQQVRQLVRKHLPKGFEEVVGWGMLSYAVPLTRYPNTYNGQPLCYVGLAAQKNYLSLYLMGAYQDPAQAAALKNAFAAAGKKFDMGKSCLRFRSPDDLPLEAIGRLIAGTSVEDFIAYYEANRPQKKGRKTGAGG